MSKTYRRLPLLGIVMIAVGGLLVDAAMPPVTMNPGDTLSVHCSTTMSGTITANDASLVCATPVPTPSPTPGTLTLLPIADAYTYASQPTVNFGTNVALRVDASPITDSFLRFDTSGLAVTSEVLRVWADTAQATGFTVHSVAGIWTESTITYSNQPPLGGILGSSGPVTAGAYYSVPISGSSFALDTTNSTALRLSSREGAHPPQLVVTTGGTPSPSPSPAPSPTVGPTPTATALPSSTSSPSPTPIAGAIQHVVIVWLENHEASSITASSMPYLFGLGQSYGVSSQFYAVSHPSEPNYLALWSGSTQGVTDDGIYNLGVASVSNQMDTAGLSWRSYQQDYPDNGACNTAATYSGGVDGPGVAGTYARKHNPAMSFTYVSGTLSRCLNVQSLSHFDPLVNLAFVVPNLINDAHDGTLAQADSFLQAFLPQVFDSPDGTHTLLVVSFDEGTSNTNGGGRIYTMVARFGMTSGLTSSTVHNHYSLLRTIEDIFGLPCLSNSCSAAPLSEFLP